MSLYNKNYNLLLLQALVNEWDEQERRRREREQQEASLYRNRSRLHGSGLTEEEQEEKEFRRRFPQFNQVLRQVDSKPGAGPDLGSW